MSENNQQIIFNEQPIETTIQPSLQPSTIFTETEFTTTKDQETQTPEAEPIQSLPKNKTSLLLWFTLSLFILGCLELSLFLIQQWQNPSLLAPIYTVSIALGGYLLGQWLWQQRLAYQQQQKNQQQQQQAQQLADEQSLGSAEPFCRQIIQTLPQTPENQAYILQWQQLLKPELSNQEVIQLFDHQVLQPIDQQAKQLILRQASETAIIVGISPLLIMDMIVVLWRGQRLVRDVSQLYGLTWSVFSHIRLTRQILKQMVFVGTTELLTELSPSLLGLELSEKLSMRAAQGLSTGLLMGRLGTTTLYYCRPILSTEKRHSFFKQLVQNVIKKISHVP